MSGGGNEIRVRNGRRVQACRDKTRNMCDVDHHIRADLVANLANTLKIERSGVCGRARDYHFGFTFQSDFFHFVVIEKACFFVHAVRHGVIILARNGDGTTVG